MELSPKLVLPKGALLQREAPSGKTENKKKKGRKGGGEGRAPESEAPQTKKQYYWIYGRRKLMPFHEFGYSAEGGESRPKF